MERRKVLSYLSAGVAAGTIYKASKMDIDRNEKVYSVSDPEDFPDTRKYDVGKGSETFSYKAFLRDGFSDSLDEFDL
ncbi:MAG: hypothetical protein R6V35_04990 [Candidatus Nanohaloarchaea archaeon]